MESTKLESEATDRRQAEFIDHTLLAPEYLRDPNNFIIDLIEHPMAVVYQKSMNLTTSATTRNARFMEKDTLASELQFPNSMFQFVNKQGQLHEVEENVSEIASEASVSNLAEQQPTPEQSVEHEGSSFNQFSELPLLRDSRDIMKNDEGVIKSNEVIYGRSSSRKVLPHKKRISRKLEVGQNDNEFGSIPAPLEPQAPTKEHLPVSPLQFHCEICNHSTSTQLEFFTHLKLHYEPKPTSPDAVIAAATPLEIMPQEKVRGIICLEPKKSLDSNANQDFLNFDNFHPLENDTVGNILHENQEDAINIHKSNNIEKCINFVDSQANDPPLSDKPVDEDEFSEAEDMLDGIRNVVDKVSIEEDDDMEFIALPHGERSSWVSSNICVDNDSKGKPFSDLNFSLPFAQILANGDNDIVDESQQQQIPTSSGENLPEEKLERNLIYFKDDFDNSPIIVRNENEVELSLKLEPEEVQDEIVIEEILTEPKSEYLDIPAELEENSVTHYTRSKSKNAETASPTKLPKKNGATVELLNEQELVKKSPSSSRYVCLICKRKFNSWNALKYHDRTHTGDRPYQCDVCQKSFFAMGALKSHKLTHTEEKPHECPLCGRKFRQYGDMKLHAISIHSDEKKYQCEFCGKAFARKYSLVVHRRIHTRERYHQCEHCGKGFRASTHLETHRKIHTGEKPYECTVCSRKFRVAGDMKRHMRIHNRKPLILTKGGVIQMKIT